MKMAIIAVTLIINTIIVIYNIYIIRAVAIIIIALDTTFRPLYADILQLIYVRISNLIFCLVNWGRIFKF